MNHTVRNDQTIGAVYAWWDNIQRPQFTYTGINADVDPHDKITETKNNLIQFAEL